ncbi:MAG: hypothetical protein HC771_22430 [Synechococcales cyanobacterium CRU_2_2]|nr:hypothetical protein [Synechococcales cyanobacterium CRU_2_2]
MTEEKAVAKRITITLPDVVHAELAKWAEQRGQTTAPLAAFLIELAIRDAKESGELKTPLSAKGDRDE